jgi:hypothetical protein
MPTIENTSVHIKGNDGQVTTGSLQTTHYDHGECVKRALLKLGLFWLLALVSSPIIIVHFVLVPGFLIAGPWMAYRTFQTTYTRNHVQGQCPECKEDVEIKMEARDELPKWTYCPRCNNPLQILDINSVTKD